MGFLAKLRKESIKKALKFSVVYIVMAFFFVVYSDAGAIFKFCNPKTLAELTPETMEGAYVKDSIDYIHTVYAKTPVYKNDNPEGIADDLHYLIDMGEEYYMSLTVLSSGQAEANALEEASCQNYLGELDETQLPTMEVSGFIEKMDAELTEFYYEIADGNAETEAVMFPYSLKMGYLDYFKKRVSWAGAIGALLLIIVTIGMLLRAITGGGQRKLEAKIAAMGDETTILEQLKSFYDDAASLGDVHISQDFVLFEYMRNSILLRPWDIAWVYALKDSRSTSGKARTIKGQSRRMCTVSFYTLDGERYRIGIMHFNPGIFEKIVRENIPGATFGYSKKIKKRYRNNRQWFVDRWEKVRPGCTDRK